MLSETMSELRANHVLLVEDNPADAGTKPLNEPRLKRLLDMVGVKFLVGTIAALQVITGAQAIAGAMS